MIMIDVGAARVFLVDSYWFQASVRKQETGNPSVLNRSPITLSDHAFRTATGVFTSVALTTIVFPSILIFAG
jgi:hypothetical protein